MFDVPLKNNIGHINGVLMCATLIILKTSMLSLHLKLVKDIPKTFKNLDYICVRPFVISISARLQKILVNHQDVWGLHAPQKVKSATTLG